jgi:hypothetical protein
MFDTSASQTGDANQAPSVDGRSLHLEHFSTTHVGPFSDAEPSAAPPPPTPDTPSLANTAVPQQQATEAVKNEYCFTAKVSGVIPPPRSPVPFGAATPSGHQSAGRAPLSTSESPELPALAVASDIVPPATAHPMDVGPDSRGAGAYGDGEGVPDPEVVASQGYRMVEGIADLSVQIASLEAQRLVLIAELHGSEYMRPAGRPTLGPGRGAADEPQCAGSGS